MEEFVIDRPGNMCFGCSPFNTQGLNMRFRHVERGVVESPYTAAEHLCGAPGVVHGGIQAVLLDEAMGVAIHGPDENDEMFVVTAELKRHTGRHRPPVAQLELRVHGHGASFPSRSRP